MKEYYPVLIWFVAILITSVIGFFQHNEVGANSAKNNAAVNKTSIDKVITPRPTKITDTLQSKVEPSEQKPLIPGKSNQTPPDSITRINEIKNDLVGTRVTVIAEITDSRVHRKGHIFLNLADDTGEILAPVFSDKGIDSANLTPGVICRFSGEIQLYKGEFEIIPERQDDVQVILKPGQKRELPITEADSGKQVQIIGQVLTKYQHPEGHLFLKVLIVNTNQQLSIPVFKSLGYDPKQINMNSIISVEGEVSLYKGNLQVVPTSARDIKVIEHEDEEEPVLLGIEQISNTDIGRMVQIRGFVRNVSTHKGDTFFHFEDKQGNRIKAVLFLADSKETIGRKLKLMEAANKGYPIRVLATVNEYKGNLQLIIDKVFNEY